MSNVSSREETVRSKVFYIPLPAVWGDLVDLYTCVQKHLPSDYDDVATVTSDGEYLYVRVEQKTNGSNIKRH